MTTENQRVFCCFCMLVTSLIVCFCSFFINGKQNRDIHDLSIRMESLEINHSLLAKDHDLVKDKIIAYLEAQIQKESGAAFSNAVHTGTAIDTGAAL